MRVHRRDLLGGLINEYKGRRVNTRARWWTRWPASEKVPSVRCIYVDRSPSRSPAGWRQLSLGEVRAARAPDALKTPCFA